MVYTHILVPTDFSPAAHRALVYALEEATQHQDKLTLLHVVQHHPTTEVYYIKNAPQSGTGYAEFGEKLPSFPPHMRLSRFPFPSSSRGLGRSCRVRPRPSEQRRVTASS